MLKQVDWYFDVAEFGSSVTVRWIPPLRIVIEFSDDGQLISDSQGSSAETREQAEAHLQSHMPKIRQIVMA